MTFFDFGNILSLRTTFLQNDFVYVRNIISDVQLLLLKEFYENLSSQKLRKDFLMPESNYSPRHINVIGGKATNSHKKLMKIYRDQNLITNLSYITNNNVVECPEIIENVIFTNLNQKGDTHGWHKDDYPIAFIIGIECPEENQGGEVEYISKNGKKETKLLRTKDAYIMKSDQVPHRVRPLLEDAKRTILNFTYSFGDLDIKPNGSANKFCQ